MRDKSDTDSTTHGSSAQTDASSPTTPALPQASTILAQAPTLNLLTSVDAEAQRGAAGDASVGSANQSAAQSCEGTGASSSDELITPPGQGALGQAVPLSTTSFSPELSSSDVMPNDPIASDPSTVQVTKRSAISPRIPLVSVGLKTVPPDAASEIPSQPVMGAGGSGSNSESAISAKMVTGPIAGIIKSGPDAAKPSAATAQRGRSIEMSSSVPDHDGKRKSDPSNGGAAQSSSNGSNTPLTWTSETDSPVNNQSDTPKSPLEDLATVQQGNAIPVAGTVSGTPNAVSAPGVPTGNGSMIGTGQAAPSALGSATEPSNIPQVSSMQLIQSARHAEMKLGMQSEEFGNVSISTSLGRQVLAAQISTEHPELGRILSAHLPAVEQKLSTAYGLQAKVEVNSGSSSDLASGQESQGGGRQQPNGNKGNPVPAGTAEPITTVSYPVDAVTAGSIRLDIRA